MKNHIKSASRRAAPSKAFRRWKNAWQTKATPWATPEADAGLRQALPRLRKSGLPAKASVLVPLCGNSEAMSFLSRKKFHVTGVEYVPQAVSALRRERFPGKRWKRLAKQGVISYSQSNVTVFQQDFLKFAASEAFELVYDRAALVAMNPRHRKKYAGVIVEALKPGGFLYLSAFVFFGATPPGPPFELGKTDARKLFSRLKLIGSHSFMELRPPERYRVQGVKKILFLSLVFQKPKAKL
jgi:thiopurine S-methyltransferase